MDPLGFAHLRCRQGPPRLPVPNMSHKRLNNPAEQISLNKCEAISLKRLYYPVNTPMCHYQRQLVIDSLFINLLIALPNELDSFFVASVVMINFRRWFTHKKVVYVGSTADNVRRMADVFVDLTGYPRSDLCIYPTKKKSERFVDWCNCGVIFATAECLLPDLKGGSMGSDVGLVVADDAQRAASGSHPLCEIIRAFIFAKAIFRILALTDNRIKKVAPLQVIAMNLQIGCIRSQSQLRNDILQTISSFRMQEIYISITPEMEVIANGLVEAMHSVVSLLYESDLLPSNSLQRLANFSLYSMKKKVEYKAPNLVDVFCDLEDLFAIYDALMCDGITAFALCAQPIAKRSLTIQNIIESNVHIKEAFLQPDMSNTEQMCAHKLSTLLALINKALISYGSELSRGHKLVVVVLCRNRGPYYVSAIVATLRKRFVSRKREVDIIVYGKGANMAKNLSEHSLSSGKCSIILCPCDSSAVELNVGFVDVVICCDEGLSSLYYMGRIALKNEAELYALRTNGYETNICKFTSEESTKECIDANTIKGAQLCTDNPQLFPDMTIPEIVEYWSIEIDENSGMLSTMEMLAYEEKLEATGGKDLCKSVPKSARELLDASMNETLLWQDRPQRFVEVGHSNATRTLTEVISADQHALSDHSNRLRQQALEQSCVENSSIGSMDDDSRTSSIKRHNSEIMGPPILKPKRARLTGTPSVLRIDSASFRLLMKKKPELSAESFINRIVETTAYNERKKRITEVLDKLRILLRM